MIAQTKKTKPLVGVSIIKQFMVDKLKRVYDGCLGTDRR